MIGEAFAKLAIAIGEVQSEGRASISTKPIVVTMGEERLELTPSRHEQSGVASFAKASEAFAKSSGHCCQRRGFTLIEVVVAFALMAIIASVVGLGVARSVRASQLTTSKERIERMLLQAFRFAAVSGHVSDVVIRQGEDGGFEGYLNLWEMNSKNLSTWAQSSVPIGHLSGIESINLNNCSVNKVIFRFFGGHGLSTVYAYDQFQRELAPSDFGFSPENITHRKRELEMILRPTPNENPSEKISLQPYLSSVAHYLPFPDEYLTTG